MSINNIKKNRLILLIICAICIILSCLLFAIGHRYSDKLPSQHVAELWKGDNELEFAQLGLYMSPDSTVSRSDILNFRMDMMQKLTDAAIDDSDMTSYILDAWSTSSKLTISTDRAKTDVDATVVGGSFFTFHQLKLLDGSYIYEDDFMHDRVVIDKALAWYLFGGYELEGMTLNINSIPFYIAGVVEREDDAASQKAYGGGMGLYLSYDSFEILGLDEPTVSCYELVMAEPVEGFTKKAAEEKFPIGSGEIVQISGRYNYWSIITEAVHAFSRTMRTSSAAYPYWENAAIYTESVCMWLVSIATLLLLPPAVTAAIIIIKLIIKAKNHISDVLIPKAKNTLEDKITTFKRERI